MSSIFKHTYLKYFFLFVLTFKVGLYVVESFSLFIDSDTISKVDTQDDSEKDCDEDKEIDNLKKLTVSNYVYIILDKELLFNNYFVVQNNYRTQYLEFATPPPELV